MAAALQVAFRVKPVNFIKVYKQCTTEEEGNTFIHCEVSPELLFFKNGKTYSNHISRVVPFPVTHLTHLPSELLSAQQNPLDA